MTVLDLAALAVEKQIQVYNYSVPEAGSIKVVWLCILLRLLLLMIWLRPLSLYLILLSRHRLRSAPALTLFNNSIFDP